jgi:MFS transporter, AAHS family, 4-hydroxybenzoate transporter
MHFRVASLCLLVLFFEGYDVPAMSYATPALIEAWHVRAPQFTPAVTVGGIGMLLGALCAGVLGDRIGRKPVLIACVATFGLFSLLTARATGLESLAVLRFLTCIGLGGGVPLATALATDSAPLRNPRRFVILTSIGLPIGGTAGGFVARPFATSFGWEAIFLAGGLLPLLLVPVLIIFLPESLAFRAEATSARRASPLELFRHGLALRTGAIWIANLGNLLSLFLLLLWLPAMLYSQGVSPSDAIFVTTMFAFGTILGAAIAAPLADRLGVERVIASVLILGACCTLLIGSLALPLDGLCVVIIGAGMGTGGCQPGINAISGALYPAHIRSTGAGWALGVGRVGQIVGPLVGGLLLGLGWQPRATFLVASGPAFCVALAMATLAHLRSRENRTAAIAPNSASATQLDVDTSRHR